MKTATAVSEIPYVLQDSELSILVRCRKGTYEVKCPAQAYGMRPASCGLGDGREDTLESQMTINRRCISELSLLLHINLVDYLHFEGFYLCSSNSFLDQVTFASYYVDMAMVAKCSLHF